MKIIIKDLVISVDAEQFAPGNSRERALKTLEEAKRILNQSGIELKHCTNFNWKVDKTGTYKVDNE